MFDRAVNELNARLGPVGLHLVSRADTEARTGDVVSLAISDEKRGMHAGRFRVHRSGNVYARVSSDNLSDWSNRQTTIDALDRAFIDEFLADVVEARLKPMEPRKT